jgi:streptomycin 6-kinase
MPRLRVPVVVRNKALAHGASAWLDALPDLLAGIAADWQVTVGHVFGNATEAFVAEAACADGTPAVLKLLIPRSGDAAAHEITALRLADGEGCVRLLRADVERSALLLERLGPGMFELALPIEERHEHLCAAASRLWRPAPDAGLPTGAEKGRRLVELVTRLWDELDRPCTERAVAHAVACAERRIAAHRDERASLVHGDVHQWNALLAPDGSYKLVDPDGLLAEPEYDLGILLREDPSELMTGDPRERSRWLASRTDCDAESIWEWGVVERVSTGLVCTRVDLQPVGREMLAAADRIAAHEARPRTD